VKALDEHPGELSEALENYEAGRRPIVEKLFKASKTSAAWYQDFANHMSLSPLEFAYAYIVRSGRIDDMRLRKMAPKFMAKYESVKSVSA
jgi:hypothetical protein